MMEKKLRSDLFGYVLWFGLASILIYLGVGLIQGLFLYDNNSGVLILLGCGLVIIILSLFLYFIGIHCLINQVRECRN